MASEHIRDRIRIAVDTASTELMVDIITGASPDAWRGTDLQVEFAAFRKDELLSVANYSNLTLTIKPKNRSRDISFASKTIGGGDINPNLTLDQWKNGVSQHGTFIFTYQEMRLDLANQAEAIFWLSISAVTVGGNRVTLGGTNLRVIEDGSPGDAPTPPLGNPLYLTADQTLASIGNPIYPRGNKNGTSIMLPSENGQWATLIFTDNTGALRMDKISLI